MIEPATSLHVRLFNLTVVLRLFHCHHEGRGQGRRQDDLLGIFLSEVPDHEDSRKVGFTPLIGLHLAVVIHPDPRRDRRPR